ncbi:MAG: hypothetical protein K2Q14_00540 [Gammaproteobacteria bacterium]|nr:hypothetical protein [Gammaproteobacteria bacterium]
MQNPNNESNREKRKAELNERIENNHRTEYFTVQGSPRHIEPDGSLWELRIACHPTKANMEKVADVIGTYLPELYEHVNFKIYLLNNIENNDIAKPTVKWDPLFAPRMDRDQRGKEVCIYMHFDMKQGAYERAPAEWKSMLLNVWKALQDADIQGLGYTTASGDKPITTSFGLVTPFSTASNRPWLGEDGIANPKAIIDEARELLLKNPDIEKKYVNRDKKNQGIMGGLYNKDDSPIYRDPRNIDPSFENGKIPAILPIHDPLGFKNPMAGVVITLQDLLEYGIDIPSFIKMQHRRIYDTQQHIDRFEVKLVDLGRKVVRNALRSMATDNGLDGLDSMLKELSTEATITDIKKSAERIKTILRRYPQPSAEMTLEMDPDISTLIELIDDVANDSADFDLAEIQTISARKLKELPALTKAIENKFHKYISIDEGYELIHIAKISFGIEDLIKANPAAMQELFIKWLHYKNEQKLLFSLKETFPEELHELYEAIEKLNPSEPSQALLQKQLLTMAHHLTGKLAAENQNEEINDQLSALEENSFGDSIFLDTSITSKTKLLVDNNNEKINHRNNFSTDGDYYDLPTQIKMVSCSANSMVSFIMNRGNSDEDKTIKIKQFEQSVHTLPIFDKKEWTMSKKLLATVAVAAVGVVIGAVGGAIIEATVLGIMTIPAGGIGALPGALSGLVHGSATGWAWGLALAAAVGLDAGLATSFGLFAPPKKNIIDDIADSASAVKTLPCFVGS